MIKRSIGIDISSSHLCAVQLSRNEQQLFVEKVSNTQIRRSTDSVLNILKKLFGQEGFDRSTKIAIALPYNSVLFRNLESNCVGDEHTNILNISALEHSFPIEPDEIITQICSSRQLSNERCVVLAAATTRTALGERLNIFKAAGVIPAAVDAAILAACATTKINHPEISSGTVFIVHIDESYIGLAVIQNNEVLIIRSISITPDSDSDADSLGLQLAHILAREIEITWQKVLGSEQIEQGCRIYIAAAEKLCDNFKTTIEEKLNCQVVPVDPYANVIPPVEHNNNGSSVCVAQGLALRMLQAEKNGGVNFLESAQNDAKRTPNLKKELITCAILVAVIVLTLLGGLFVRLLILESEYAEVKKEIREVFKRTLPEETSIINPLAQLEQKLQLLRKEYSLFSPVSQMRLGPLEVLYAVSTSIPSEATINIDDMLITPEYVRLTGVSRSFESIYDWQDSLTKVRGFSNINVQNVKKDTTSQMVNFTMTISLAAVESE